MRVDLTSVWYRQSLHPLAILLWPLSFLFAGVVALRRWLYRSNILKTQQFSVPIIVVGNITVGGTGKTPLVIHLAQLLQAHGYHPGIVTRGFGGKAHMQPCWVKADSSATEVGDEALMLAQRTHCPVVVGVNRAQVVRDLLQHSACDIVISDDGLQHYPMGRTLELVVVDGERRFGNQLLLPAGPLREKVSRLKHVDFVVVNGGGAADEYIFSLQPDKLISVRDNARALDLSAFATKKIHAIAGIGHPERFFNSLRQAGFDVIPHVFPDHHLYQRAELEFNDGLPVLMTEKDAVKCRQFADDRFWYLSVTTKLNTHFEQAFLSQILQR